jgi:sulfate permease, SulP family
MTTDTPVRRDRVLLPTLAGYRRSWIGPDIIAGLSAGAVVVPQAMAYATIANLPVQIGLYTCIVPMLVYALLGGSRAMSVSTTSTIATLTATTLVTAGVAASAKDPDAALGSLVTLTLLVGVILLLARLLRLGGLVENISQATVLGVKIGVGATVAIGQLPKLLGVSVNTSGEGFIAAIATIVKALPDAVVPTILLSVASILVLVLLGRFAPRVPATLIVVVGGILLVWLAHIDRAGVALIAPVPSGFPLPELPDLRHIGALVPGALAIAVMAFLESAAVARGIRKPTDPVIDADRELFATGAANAVGAFFSAMPAAGGFSQSAVNQRAGARSQIASLVTVVLAVAVALFLGPVVSLLPQATLASMVFVAVAGLIAIPELVRWWSLSRRDFWIAIVVALLGLTAGLLVAVAAGVVITLLLVLRELNTPVLDVIDRRGDAIAVHLGRGLYTANALANERAVAELARVEKARAVVLDIVRQRVMTVTVLEALQDLDRELAANGVTLHLVRVAPPAEQVLRKTEWFRDLEASGRVHDSVTAGLDAATAAPA